MINKVILLKTTILSCCIFAQNNNNQDLLNKLIKEKKSFSDDSTNISYNKNILFKQLFTINNGLPNLENRNGIYAPNGALLQHRIWLKSKFIIFSFEPTLIKHESHNISNTYSNSAFKYSNSTNSKIPNALIKNTELSFIIKI